jgi:hypothetical protein
MPSRIEIAIEARDNASGTLDSVRNKLQLFDQFGRTASDLTEKFEGVTRSIGGFDLSVSKTSRGIRALAVPIVSELSPALGQMGSQMAGVITTAAALGSGIGAVSIAVAAAAGIVGGQALAAWQKHVEMLERFKVEQRSLDFDTVVSGLTKERAALSLLSEEYDELRRKVEEAKAARAPLAGTEFDPGSPVDPDDRRLREARARVEARAQRAQAFTEGRRASDFVRAEHDDAGQGTATDTAAQEARRRLATIRRQVTEAGILDPIERQFQAAIREAELLRTQPGGGGEQGAIADRLISLAQAQRAEALRLRAASTLGRDAVDVGQGFEAAVAGADSTADRVARIAIEARLAKTAIDELRDSLERDVTGGQMETALAGVSPEDLREGFARQREELEQQLEITQHLGLLTSQRTDLTLKQREALTLERIEIERLLKLELARGDQAKEYAAEIEAALRRRQLLETVDARAGLERGLTDVEVEFGSAGLRMREAVHQVGGDVGRALADQIAGPLEARLKDMPPLLRSVLSSMLRSGADMIGKELTAQLFGGLRSLLSGGGTPGLVPFGEGARAGGGSVFGGNTNITLSVAGRPLPESELRKAYAAGGDAGVRALQQGRATVVGGEFIPETFDLPGFSTSSVALSPTRTPSLFDRALPIAGHAAAFGTTAFASTGAQSAFDVGASGALGALTGAGLGRSIGSLFGGSGSAVGAGAGALAGAAITTTLALLAKQEADRQAKRQRETAEVARASGAGSDLVSSASQARSIPDLIRRITAFGSGTSGGAANPAVPVTVNTPNGPRAIGRENPAFPVATLSEFLAAPETLQANIQAGVDPAQLAGPNAATSQALRQIATDMVGQFRETEQGISVTEEDRLMPSGLRRRTSVPATRAAALGEGGDLEIDELALATLDPDDRAAVLLDILNQVAQDRDIVSTVSDGATGQITSVTRIPRSTIVIPPATTPVPAPVTPSTPPGSTTPPPSTADAITAGGLAAIGIVAQLADPNSLLNSLLPAGFTGTDLANLIGGVFGNSAAPIAAGGVLSGVAPEAIRDALAASGQTATAVGFQAGGTFGVGQALAVLGGLNAIYGLVQGAETGDPVSIASSVASLYGAVAGVANAFGAGLPTVGGAISSAVGALASAAAGGGAAGAQAAATAVSAIAPVAAILAPVLIWAAYELTKPGPADAWAIIGKTATALQTVAWVSIKQANDVFTALRATGTTDPNTIQGALSLGANALFAYHRTVQNPRGGVISIADFYAYTGQDPGPLQAQAAQLQQNMKDATAFLIASGSRTAAQLGQVPVTKDWAEMMSMQGYGTALQAAPKTLPGQPGGQWVSQGEGTVWVEDGTTTPPQDVTGHVNQGIGLNEAQGRYQPPDAINAQFGGPFWTMWAYLTGSNSTPDPGEAVGTPRIAGAQPWLAGGAAPGVVSGPDAKENPLSVEEVRMLLAIAAQWQAAFTSGGGDGADGSTGDAGISGAASAGGPAGGSGGDAE